MAFEAFRAQSEAPARSGRKRLFYAVSIAVHGALIGAGIVYSFWHIEELSPPLLKVTFLSAAPPPPPAPPPPAGGAAPIREARTVKPKPVVKPKLEIVQPKEVPKQVEPEPSEQPKPEEKGEPGGVKGGTIGGTPGGTIGGTPGGTIGGTPGGTGSGTSGPAKFLPPNIGEGQRIAGDKGVMPAQLTKTGLVYRVLLKVCVSTAGTVDKLTMMKGSDPLADAEALRVVKTWRFRPFMVNGAPAPFCYPQTIEFRTEDR